MIRNFCVAVLSALILQSCADDTRFYVDKDECAGFQIVQGSQLISISRDTAWSIVDEAGNVVCPADAHKISAFFNVLRDIQVMGMSQKDASGSFDCEVRILGESGRAVRNLRFSAVPGSSNMIGSSDGGKCYVVGVPGLNQSPIGDFSAALEYWKDRSLLCISAENLSMISVCNYVESAQSFQVSTSVDAFEVRDAQGDVVDIQLTSIKRWLGGISGVYRADGYVDSLPSADGDIIYRLKTRTRLGLEDSVVFYRKYMPDGKPDFNKMYFRKGADVGTAKYFDFDKLLVDLDALRR